MNSNNHRCFREILNQRMNLTPSDLITPCFQSNKLRKCVLVPASSENETPCGKYFCDIHSSKCSRCGQLGHFEENRGYKLSDDCFRVCQFCKKTMCLECVEFEEDNCDIILLDIFPKCLECPWVEEKHTCKTCLKNINDSVKEGRDCPFKKNHQKIE